MFGSSKNENNQKKSNNNITGAVNIFGFGTVIHGEIRSENDIRIDGKVIGTVSSDAKVVVGESGIIEGDIKCKDADIFGRIKGNIETSNLLFLKSTANIEGDIITQKLVVEKGAIFNGACQMGQKATYHEQQGEKVTPKLQKEAV